MKTKFFQSVIVCLVVVIFSGVVLAGPSAGGTLTVGLQADPPKLDPHMSSAKVDRQVLKSIYDSLVSVDQNMNLVPALASDWEIVDEGKTYIFQLRQDVKFHDGTKFNAAAVKFNFERILDPDLGSPRKSELSLIDKIEVIAEYQLRIELSKPFTPFLATLADRAGMIVSPTAVEKWGDDYATHPVGTGPFKFVERAIQEKIVLEKNAAYWQEDLPYLDKVIYKPYTDGNVRVINLTSGDLDLIDTVPPKDVDKLIKDPKIQVDMASGLGFQGMWINKGQAPFDNHDLTQALAKSINRQALIKVVFGETAFVATSPFPPGTVMHDASRQGIIMDLTGAKEKLKAGGQPNGYTFDLLVAPSPTNQQTAQLIQSMAAQAGIEVKISLLEFGTLLDRLQSGNYQAALLGWSGRIDADGNTFRFFHSTGGLNNSFYQNDEVDQILEKTRQISDVKTRKALFSDLMKHLDRDLPYIFVYHPKEINAFKKRVHGFATYPDGLLRLHEVWVEE